MHENLSPRKLVIFALAFELHSSKILSKKCCSRKRWFLRRNWSCEYFPFTSVCLCVCEFFRKLHCWRVLRNWGSFWLDGRCHAWGKQCSLKDPHRTAGFEFDSHSSIFSSKAFSNSSCSLTVVASFPKFLPMFETISIASLSMIHTFFLPIAYM